MRKLRKTESETKLQRDVRLSVNRHADGYENVCDFLNDLMHGGCQSGIIGELVYYQDTVAFYRKHRAEINALLGNMLDETGLSDPRALFGNRWEQSDPLALDTYNQNLLAWFGYEETARQLGERAGCDL